jgi:RNA polymerase sigma-70 factor (ECF subfamily)
MHEKPVAPVGPPRADTVGAEAERLDPAAFGLLYQTHRLAVYRYLRARTQSEDEALDLAAITFERAYTSLHRFRRRDGGVQAWLFRIARNTAIDAHRSRRQTVDLAGADAQLGRIAVEADRIHSENADVLDLVARLPQVQGETLLLRYAGGLTAREIGAVIGKRESAVQKQIERGLAALREAFDDHS